jgi:hypothetical protein
LEGASEGALKGPLEESLERWKNGKIWGCYPGEVYFALGMYFVSHEMFHTRAPKRGAQTAEKALIGGAFFTGKEARGLLSNDPF